MWPNNALPFSITIHAGRDENRKSFDIRDFAQSEAEATVNAVYLVEFVDLKMEFRSAPGVIVPSRSRLYLDGLDGISRTQTAQDETGAVYLRCPSEVVLYEYASSDASYPWIPGLYRLCVLWESNEYHTILRVMPKNMTDDQLELMRRELETHLRGLALDVMLRNQGIGSSDSTVSLPERFYQYRLIEREYARLFVTLQDIVRRPHQQAAKIYEVMPVHRATIWDDRTLRWLQSEKSGQVNVGLRHPHLVLAPRSQVNFDLPENQWVKKVIADLILILSAIRVAVDRTLVSRQDLLDEEMRFSREKQSVRSPLHRQVELLRETSERSRLMQGQLWEMLNSEFFREVSTRNEHIPITLGLQRDHRYWQVYQFWQQLLSRSEVHVRAALDYQWKRTDLLYEYWCFVQLVTALQQLGFIADGGWLFAQDHREHEEVFIPDLDLGTRVHFTHREWSLELVYNETVPDSRAQAIVRASPVYTMSRNNKPDMRLDVYREGVYQGACVFEVKYRRGKYIWNYSDARHLWSDNMEQLTQYMMGLTTIDGRRAARRVIALYPRDPVFDRLVRTRYDEISLLQLTPGDDPKGFWEIILNDVLGAFEISM